MNKKIKIAILVLCFLLSFILAILLIDVMKNSSVKKNLNINFSKCKHLKLKAIQIKI